MTGVLVHQDRIARANLIWLIVAQAICILPLLVRLPIWIAAIWVFAVIWRVQIHRARWAFPSFVVKLVMGLGSALGIYITYNGVSGVDPMIGFLVCSFILKVIEMRSKKDALIVLFIGFIAIASQFLFAQGILSGLYGLFSIFILLAAWQAAFVAQSLHVKTHLRRGVVLLGQSLPFMLILFVGMPRLGPLWSVPSPQGAGKTGFSETMELGDIGDLVQSPEIAFRVSFLSQEPPVNTMYWRGLALDLFNGQTWSASSQAQLPSSWGDNNERADFEYSVIMEPHHYRWLFSLGVPLAAESAQLKLHKNQQDLLVSRAPVVSKAEYRVRSKMLPIGANSKLDPFQAAQLIYLPESSNPKARSLAQAWVAEGKSPPQIIDAALAHFSRDFSYTLRPPLLGENAIDGFLFQTRRGFCEHFASSFVFLMRASGIPARVMVGYQGGELNSGSGNSGNYYVVRQSDAHAWAEVWLAEQGWITVDPTAAVAPSRIELGLEQSLAEDERHMLGGQNRLLTRLYQRFDAMEYSWNRWVLNYDSDSQEGVFERLFGISSPWRVGVAFTVLCAVIFFGLMGINAYLKRSLPLSVENKLMQSVLRKLHRRGVQRLPNETISQLAIRIADTHPQVAAGLRQVDHWYCRAVYAEEAGASEKLKSTIRSLRW
jgi:protein-glutamine gamma-glutamyltransferase